MEHIILFRVDVKIRFKKHSFDFSFKKLIMIFALKILIRLSKQLKTMLVNKTKENSDWLRIGSGRISFVHRFSSV